MTTERAVVSAIPDGEGPDPETLRRARQIAARLAVPRPRRDVTARRGLGELASLRYRGGSDDIDLDRTVAQLVEHPLPDEDDIIVRSGSGRGAACCCWSTCPARCGASGSAPLPPPSARSRPS